MSYKSEDSIFWLSQRFSHAPTITLLVSIKKKLDKNHSVVSITVHEPNTGFPDVVKGKMLYRYTIQGLESLMPLNLVLIFKVTGTKFWQWSIRS